MTTVLTRTAATLAVCALTGATLALTTSPAAAASYKCKTSSKSLDMPMYDGPWPDNYKFTVKVCAKRSGSTVYSYATVKWDAPSRSTYEDTFDAASLRVYIKKSRSGPDPVLTYKTYGFTDKSNGPDGSHTSRTISYKVGSAKGLGDAALKLNWNNDGKGTKHYGFSASPRV